MRLRGISAVVAPLALWVGCAGSHASTGSSGTSAGSSGSSGTGDSSSSSSSSGFPVASHTPWPTIPNQGGATVTAPELVTLTFDGDANQAAIDAWSKWLVTSDWLTQVGADYHVSHGTDVAVHLPASDLMPGSIDDGVIQSYLISKIDDATIATQPGANTIYEIFFPVSITVTENGLQSCRDIGGYHGTFSDHGHTAYYAVIPDCPTVAQQQGIDELKGIEVSASHEFIEACTDPDGSKPAWILVDAKNPWAFRTGEVADICLGILYGDSVTGNVAQRVWSNTAAKGDGPPCIPGPNDGKPFYAQSVPDELFTVDAGESITLSVSGWSTGLVSPWTAAVFEVASDGPFVTISPTAGVTVGNDHPGELTITMPAGTESGTYAVLNLWQSPPTPDTMWWPVVVVAR